MFMGLFAYICIC